MLQTCSLMLPLGGCLLSGDMPEPNLVIPASYDSGPKSPVTAQAALPSLDWWTKFRSRELTALIEEARANNLDIAAAIARIVQADAQARVTGAPLLPLITADGNAVNQQATKTGSKASIISLKQTGKSSSTGPIVTNNLTATLTASYEIDFWGKNRAAQRSAEELAVASRYDREVIELTTVVTVANTYFQILASQDRLRIARENLAAATRVLNLIKQRFDVGTASALDVAQQEILVNQQRAAIPPLEQIVRQNAATLAVLIGRTPETIRVRGGSMGMLRIPRVTPGMPSDLIAQRPDIREAEANLASADANVYAARAAFFPSIQLTGEGGYQTAVLKWLFRPESAFFSVAAGLTQPIFDGARLAGQFDLAKGRQDELLQDYRKAIINGFADVERALIAIQETGRRVRLQRDVVVSAKRAFDISETRLREGTIDLVSLLITQQALFQAQDALALDQLDHLTAVISLFQALGGGWQKPGEVSPEKAEVISAPKG
jgi:NodT family efflux transporter outer membrane factor (OMF) lipoprotein